MEKHSLGESVLSAIGSVAVAVATYFVPVLGLLGLMAFVSIVDHFFGVWRVKRMKEPFNRWAGIKRTASKIVAYGVIILVAFVADRNLANELWQKQFSVSDILAKLATLALCYHEWKSANRNFKAVTGVTLWERLMDLTQDARKIAEAGSKVKKNLLIAVVFLTSCVTSHNALKKHAKIVDKFPFVHTQDTVVIKDTVQLKIMGVDTVVEYSFKDTITRTIFLQDGTKVVGSIFNAADGTKTLRMEAERKDTTVVQVRSLKIPIRYFEKPLPWYRTTIAIIVYCLAAAWGSWQISNLKHKQNG